MNIVQNALTLTGEKSGPRQYPGVTESTHRTGYPATGGPPSLPGPRVQIPTVQNPQPRTRTIIITHPSHNGQNSPPAASPTNTKKYPIQKAELLLLISSGQMIFKEYSSSSSVNKHNNCAPPVGGGTFQCCTTIHGQMKETELFALHTKERTEILQDWRGWGRSRVEEEVGVGGVGGGFYEEEEEEEYITRERQQQTDSDSKARKREKTWRA